MSGFAVLLIGLFVLGAVAIVAVIVVGIVNSARDKRTRYERGMDEHGDMKPGTFKLTRGGGSGIDGGVGGPPM
jgi:hypothetical protein